MNVAVDTEKNLALYIPKWLKNAIQLILMFEKLRMNCAFIV